MNGNLTLYLQPLKIKLSLNFLTQSYLMSENSEDFVFNYLFSSRFIDSGSCEEQSTR